MPLDKVTIRKEKLALRVAQDEVTRKEYSALITLQLAEEIEQHPGIAAIYAPVKGEADILSFLKHKDICLPVIVQGAKEMIFRKITPDMQYVKNSYGVLEPPVGAELCLPDIVITPLSAFDRRGHRIGYGGGHYDATLAALRKQKTILAIGVGFSFQETTDLPEEPFDQMVDMIITEKEVIKFY